ncbi:M36 family metallopeptidase [Chryseobacterium sp. 'Rf worker isolate 10']|uniref:M36 family metallopeptidase n=1 Tax=Chryseobacterium sp. 'Rf worker isolate 10' TaxID=2887348 RepID=UPI003D6EE93E
MKTKALSAIITVISLYPCMSFAQNFEGILKQHVRNNSQFRKSDLSDFIVDNHDYSASLKGDVLKIQQTYNGLPIFNAVSTALVKDNRVTYYTDAFKKNYNEADRNSPVINSREAFDRIAKLLDLEGKSEYSILGFNEKTPKDVIAAKQRLVYVEDKSNLILCYEFILPENKNYWDILLSAKTGEIIHKTSLTNYCSFSDNPYHAENVSVFYPQNKEFYTTHNSNFSNLSPADASYNVFALPVEAPTFGSRSLINNPWILSSSPEGWHSDGINHYTNTTGNNVVALILNENDMSTSFVEGGSTRNFNFPFDDNGSTDININAAAVNLFYASNMAHDILYKFGFTETAKNFQSNNFGNGGVQGDPVQSIIFPLPVNNSAFVNKPDGTPGELSVNLWNEPNYLYYQLPNSVINRRVRTEKATFGTQLNPVGVSGNVVIMNVEDGCTFLSTGSLNNVIGLIKAGNCDDAVKVKNAQNAGAVAAVIYEESANKNLTKMSGTDSSITIPSVKVLNSEGEYIKNLLSNTGTVNITLKNDPALERHKNLGFDNVVVMHEYVHGLSNRLTGTGYSCLDKNVSAEQMGEGWSDFYAMMFTNRPEYTEATSRGVGTYGTDESINGFGIRPAKYSTDFSVNDYTYGRTNGMQRQDLSPNEHSIGFIWGTMLWDLHWKYAQKYGYSSNVLANTTNGSSRVLQLVTDALKLQVCNPTFIDGRNAILAAELATTQGQNKCMIWGVFARRGLGVNASAGVKNNINDQIQDFNVPEECLLATNEVSTDKNKNVSIYPNPAKDEFYIKFPSNTLGKVSVELYDMSGKLVSSEDKVSPDAKKAISTSNLVNGTYMVKIKGLGFEASSKVMVKK